MVRIFLTKKGKNIYFFLKNYHASRILRIIRILWCTYFTFTYYTHNFKYLTLILRLVILFHLPLWQVIINTLRSTYTSLAGYCNFIYPAMNNAFQLHFSYVVLVLFLNLSAYIHVVLILYYKHHVYLILAVDWLV